MSSIIHLNYWAWETGDQKRTVFMLIKVLHRSIQVWEELQTALDELPPARCKTGKLHQRGRRSHPQST